MQAVSRATTRRRMPRAEREDVMLHAAGQVFARSGFHDASMDDIAEAAGISKPMLYNYFGSKQGLYIAYLERSGRSLLAAMREAGAQELAGFGAGGRAAYVGAAVSRCRAAPGWCHRSR